MSLGSLQTVTLHLTHRLLRKNSHEAPYLGEEEIRRKTHFPRSPVLRGKRLLSLYVAVSTTAEGRQLSKTLQTVGSTTEGRYLLQMTSRCGRPSRPQTTSTQLQALRLTSRTLQEAPGLYLWHPNVGHGPLRA